MNIKKQLIHGFTIVELLIVIAIIGILTTIVAVSYNGVQNNAIGVSLQSDLSNASDFLRIDQARSSTGSFPDTLALANGGKGIPLSSGTSYPTYARNNNTLPHTFCLTATKSGQNYFITQEGTPMPGVCPVFYLDAGIATSYSGTGTVWNDLGGNGQNGTLNGGVTYSNTNGGVMNFNGSNGYASFSTAPNITTAGSISAWVYVNSWGSNYDSVVFKGPGTTWASIDYGLFRNSSSNTFLGTINDGTNNLGGAGPNSSVITLGRWYNLTFTWDSTVTKFYTNGLQTGSVNYTHGAGSRSTNMKIGSDVGGATYLFNGSMSDIRIYNRALTASDVNKNFNTFSSRYGL